MVCRLTLPASPTISKLAITCISAVIIGCASPVEAQIIHQDHKLLASDGAPGDRLGDAVDIDNGIVVLGAWQHDELGSNSGAAYLYNATTGDQLRKLVADNGQADDHFGFSVGIDDQTVAIGANGNGTVYLFDADTGDQLHAISSPSKSGSKLGGDGFGRSLAIDAGLLIVGAPFDDALGANTGAAYIFDATTGALLHTLIADDRAAGDGFGLSVAIDGGLAIIGAWNDDDLGSNSGSAYIFHTSTGEQLHKITASDAQPNDWFGIAVAIDQQIVGVGARMDDDLGDTSGSAYLFDATTGTQLHKLNAQDGAAGDLFGASIALDDGLAIVGAYHDDDAGINSGSAYLFDTQTGLQRAKLLPEVGNIDDFFGIKVAIDQGVMAVGARWDQDNGTAAGAGYIFDGSCPADMTNDRLLDFFDISAFIDAFAEHDSRADFTDDGQFDFFDVSKFLDLFAQHCP